MPEHVFGPVPSRRLGQSLGIDPVPLKTCNWNCVYCQLGRSRPIINERREYLPIEEILIETRAALQAHNPGEIDWVTFIGSGETTLHSDLGEMIRTVKQWTDLPIAVITNGSLLYLPEVRDDLLLADAVLPSLDAGNAALYKKINRPHPELTFERLVEGLVQFRQVYPHQLWIEVMLIAGVNDQEAELHQIAQVLSRIQPDEVHVLQPTRPPVEPWVHPPDEAALVRAQAILGSVAKTILPAKGTFDLSGEANLVDAIVDIITRHPMKESELLEALADYSTDEIRETLQALAGSGKAQRVTRYDTYFWSAAQGFYPADETE